MSDTPTHDGLTQPDVQPPPPPADAPTGAKDDSGKRSRRGGKGKGPKQAKEKGARNKDAKRAKRSDRRAVPDETFDFLGGRFTAAVRTRVMNLVLIAVLVLVGGTFIARAVTAGVANANDNSAADAARQRNTVVELELEQRAGSGTATLTDVDDHISGRSKVIAAATEQELDLPMIFASINSLAPGTTVSSISIGGASSEAAPADDSGTETTAPPDESNKISLTGAIARQDQAPGLNAALQSLDWAEGGAATLSCGAGSEESSSSGDDTQPTARGACTWDWTGTFTEGAYSTRSTDIPAAVARPGSEQGGN